MRSLTSLHVSRRNTLRFDQRGASRRAPVKSKANYFSGLNFTEWSKSEAWIFGGALIMAVGVFSSMAVQNMLPYVDREITHVDVQGALSDSRRKEVDQQIAGYAHARFFSVDLSAMRNTLEDMPWIARADIRRVWPDQLIINLYEQQPVARWGDQQLLNNKGQLFLPINRDSYGYLPHLQGEVGSEQQVMQTYQLLSQLLRPLGLTVLNVELRDREAWFFSVGVTGTNQVFDVMVGREHLLEKMRNFVVIYQKKLQSQVGRVAHVDLRYSKGLAVAWRSPS